MQDQLKSEEVGIFYGPLVKQTMVSCQDFLQDQTILTANKSSYKSPALIAGLDLHVETVEGKD